MTAPAAAESRWTVEAMKRRLAKDPVAVERALQTLYYQQTDREQAADVTEEDNGVGFNGADAEFFSKMARWVIGSRYPEGQKLTPKQLKAVQRGIGKYAAQLLRLSGLPVRHEKKSRTSKEAPVSQQQPYRQAKALVWGEKKAITTAQQGAWSDEWQARVPLLQVNASRQDLEREVASYNQSSWGALRWQTYRLLEVHRDHVIIQVSEHLCD